MVPNSESRSSESLLWESKKLFAWWVTTYFLLHLWPFQGHKHCKMIPNLTPKRTMWSFQNSQHFIHSNNAFQKIHIMQIIPSSSRVWISVSVDMDEACNHHYLYMTEPVLVPFMASNRGKKEILKNVKK